MSEGLSRVGMDNAVISQRMAEGFEDFWLPSLTSPGNPDRMNYLPLGYWIESQWYNLFGDNSFMAEKVYSVLTYFIIAVLMLWIWSLYGMPKKTGWIPLLCWITIPIVSWSATNNLLESTMTMFILLSVVFLLKSFKISTVIRMHKAVSKSVACLHLYLAGWLVLAALAMEMAFMVKGFSGLFPIVLPLLYWLFLRRDKIINPIIATAIIVMVWIVTIFTVILFSPDIYQHLYNYIHHQMIGGLLHVQTVTSRFYIIYVLVVQLVVPLSIIFVLSLIRIKNRPFYRYIFYFRNRKKLTALQAEYSSIGWMTFALGLSGILPIMLGFKQHEFYIVPTLPFFALASACLLYYLLEDWLAAINKVAQCVLVAMAILIFGSGLVLNVASIHKINSNETLLGDMKIILPFLQQGETVSVSKEVIQNPEVAEYFYRYKQVSFDSMPGQTHLISMFSDIRYKYNGVCYSDKKLPTQQYRLYELCDLSEPICSTEDLDKITESTETQSDSSLHSRLFHPLNINY